MPNFSKQLTEQSVHQVHDIRLPEELLHVAHIGVEGVRRERFLEDEVLPVLVEYHFIRIFWLFVHFIICIAPAAKLQVHKRWGNLDEWVCMGMVTN